jgi:alpha-mannosidase
VDVMAFKPRGNPLAPLAQPDPRDGVTMRLRDLAGRDHTTAAVRLFTGASRAAVTGLLEEGETGPAGGGDGVVTAAVPERGTVTLAITPGQLMTGSGQDPRPAANGAPPEPAQPIFTRYWLHGKGPAPAGNLPVAVHLSPGRLAMQPGESAGLRVTVACGPEPASGTVQLDVPEALTLISAASTGPASGVTAEAGPGSDDTDAGKLPYHLAACGFAAWDVLLQVPDDSATARHFVAARIIDDVGQVLEDVAVIAVGEAAAPGADAPLDELPPALETISLAEAAEATLTRLTGHLELPPGGRGNVAIRLSNTTASELRGEAHLISPHGSWTAHQAWTTSFVAEPDRATDLSFSVAIPRDARPGQRWWALVKVMYFGRLRYSEPVWITVTADRPAR